MFYRIMDYFPSISSIFDHNIAQYPARIVKISNSYLNKVGNFPYKLGYFCPPCLAYVSYPNLHLTT